MKTAHTQSCLLTWVKAADEQEHPVPPQDRDNQAQ